MNRLAVLTLFSLGACSGPAAPTTTAEAPEPEAVPVPIECQNGPAALPSYDAILDGAPFSLEVMRDESGAWLPRRPLHMPLHHASMITWVDEHDLFGEHTSRAPVLVFATGVGTPEIVHDEERNVFFATYTARVDRICAVP